MYLIRVVVVLIEAPALRPRELLQPGGGLGVHGVTGHRPHHVSVRLEVVVVLLRFR